MMHDAKNVHGHTQMHIRPVQICMDAHRELMSWTIICTPTTHAYHAQTQIHMNTCRNRETHAHLYKLHIKQFCPQTTFFRFCLVTVEKRIWWISIGFFFYWHPDFGDC